MYSIVCNHRNAQKRSNNPQPADVEYETPNPTGLDDQQPQYEDIPLGQTHHGPDADRQGLQPQQPSSSNEYETPNPQYDVIQLGQTQPGPDDGRYHSLSPETRGEQHQYEVIPGLPNF